MIKQTFKGQPGSNDSEYLIANTLASFFYLDSHNTASIQCWSALHFLQQPAHQILTY